MPVQIKTEGDVVILYPSRAGDANPDRIIITAREEIRRLIGEESRKVIVDCSELDFLSSTEVGAMIGAMRELNLVQGAIMFTGIGVRLAEIFEVMRILEVLPIRITTQEARLELSKLRKEPNLLAKLTAANPSISQINSWWDGKMGLVMDSKAPAVTQQPTPPKEKDAGPRPEDEETLYGRRGPVPIPAAQDPWRTALGIIRSAQNLCESQGVEFKPTMSFQDFLGHLSMKLPE